MKEKKIKCTIVIERAFSEAGNDFEGIYIDFIAKKIAEMLNSMRTEAFEKSICE